MGLAAALMARARAPMFPSFALPLVWLLALAAFSLTLPSAPAPYFREGGVLGWGVLTATGLWLMGAFVGSRLGWEWLGALLPMSAPVLALLLARNDLLPALWGVGIATGLMWTLLGRAWASVAGVALSVLALSWTTGLAPIAGAPLWFGVCVAGAVLAAFGLATVLARTVAHWVALQLYSAVWRLHADCGWVSAGRVGRPVAATDADDAGRRDARARAGRQ